MTASLDGIRRHPLSGYTASLAHTINAPPPAPALDGKGDSDVDCRNRFAMFERLNFIKHGSALSAQRSLIRLYVHQLSVSMN